MRRGPDFTKGSRFNAPGPTLVVCIICKAPANPAWAYGDAKNYCREHAPEHLLRPHVANPFPNLLEEATTPCPGNVTRFPRRNLRPGPSRPPRL
jgi:hypothetical protein